MSKSIRVTLTYDEAEALLAYKGGPVGLRARGTLTSALLARRDYVSPRERARKDGPNVP